MTTGQPETVVWFGIPGDCRMSGEVIGDHHVHIVFGGLDDGVEMQFERSALERFVLLAAELLALPVPVDQTDDLPSPCRGPRSLNDKPPVSRR